MALVIKRLYHGYFWLFRDMADPRTDGYNLVSSPLAPLSIMLSYLYVVYTLGPKFMENRRPFDVKNAIRVYNIIQIISNVYIFLFGLKALYHMRFTACAMVDYSSGPQGRLSLHLAYVYYVLKIADLVDTIFFVLRKSYRQISFLHVYHHCMMVLCIWVGCRYVAGGTGVWLITINSFVHVVMYLYYLLATIDDKWKNVVFKKSLTQIQLVQFLILLYIFGIIMFDSQCRYPKWVSFLMVPQFLFMLFLFGDFYIKTYVRNKKMK